MIIAKLKMSEFIDYLIEGTYENKEEWNEIMIDYACAIGSDSFEAYMHAHIRMATATSQYNLIESIVRVLEVDYQPGLVKELKSFGYMGQYNPELRERYIKDLNNALKKAKIHLVQAQQSKEQIERMNSESEGNEKPSREMFDENLITLSKYFGYQVKDTEITVLQYCLMLKRMRDHAKNN